MTYVPITDAEIDVDSPVTQVLMTKYRDNIEFAVNPISTTVITTAVASVDLTGFDASIYRSYKIELQNVKPAVADDNLSMRTSSDGGATFDDGGSNYSFTSYRVNTAGSAAAAGDDFTGLPSLATSVGFSTTDSGVSGTLSIPNPGASLKTMVGVNLYAATGAGALSSYGLVTRLENADVDAVRLFFSTRNIASGTIILWGIK